MTNQYIFNKKNNTFIPTNRSVSISVILNHEQTANKKASRPNKDEMLEIPRYHLDCKY